jgi:type II secretory pathway pseudopilin PulG
MKKNRKLDWSDGDRNRGFSTLELLVVMVVSLVIAALTVPGFNQIRRNLRISGDARDLNAAINQAKLQAAADFTNARVFVDLGANTPNTFHVDIWNKAGLGGAGCWQVVGDLANPCYVPGVSPVQSLSSGVCFQTAPGCAPLPGAPPPNTQTNGTSQAPRCLPVNGRRVGQTATTACILFNSRGMPVVAATGAPTPDDAFYLTDQTARDPGSWVYAITVSATGNSQIWAAPAHGGNWYRK